MSNFEFKTEINGEPITLVLKRYGDAPGRISRHNIGNIERQVWAYLEWGLIEPGNWPVDSKVPGHMIFDELPQRVCTKVYRAWQDSEDEQEKQESKE